MKHKLFFYFFSFSLFSILSVLTLLTQNNFQATPPSYEQAVPSHYRIKDEINNRELMRISVNIYPGDELLTQDNKLYRIVRVDEQHRYAYARFIKRLPPAAPFL